MGLTRITRIGWIFGISIGGDELCGNHLISNALRVTISFGMTKVIQKIHPIRIIQIQGQEWLQGKR